MKRIKRFGVYQTSIVAAIVLFFISLIFFLPWLLIAVIFHGIAGNDLLGYHFSLLSPLLIVPFLYAIIGFIITAIGCSIYNLITKWIGGIELEFDTTDEQ